MDTVYVFRIEAEPTGDSIVLKLWGALDAHTVPELEYELSHCLAAKPRVIVLDMSEVKYVSSAGFGAMLDGYHGCRDERSELRVASIPAAVGRVFKMLGLQKVFTAYPTVAAALADGGAQA